jgi:hypothetical protein
LGRLRGDKGGGEHWRWVAGEKWREGTATWQLYTIKTYRAVMLGCKRLGRRG